MCWVIWCSYQCCVASKQGLHLSNHDLSAPVLSPAVVGRRIKRLNPISHDGAKRQGGDAELLMAVWVARRIKAYS